MLKTISINSTYTKSLNPQTRPGELKPKKNKTCIFERTLLITVHRSKTDRFCFSLALAYAYEVEGVEYTATKDVDVNPHSLNTVGYSLSVLYDIANPSRSDVLHNDDLLLRAFLVILLDVVVGIILFVVVIKYAKSKC